MRCGKYVSPECTLDFAPVQVRDTFCILLSRALLEVPFGKYQGRLAGELSADRNRVRSVHILVSLHLAAWLMPVGVLILAEASTH